MSTITSRPRVQSVSGALVTAAATGTVILATQMIRLLFSSLSSDGKRIFVEQTAGLPDSSGNLVKSVTPLRQQFQMHQENSRVAAEKALPPVEALRVATLLGMAAVPFRIQEASAIKQSWLELQKADDLPMARRKQEQLIKTLETGHHAVFVSALSLACRNAALTIGFEHVQTTTGPHGETRVIATDAAGRTLVNEIHTDQQRQIGLKTEVVNVLDNSCSLIQDAFDRALENQGVRAANPERKFTGGVCELAAAREFVRRKVTRTAVTMTSGVEPQGADQIRRAQRLNAKNIQSKHQSSG